MRNAELSSLAELPEADQGLVEAARAARETAYCPYSHFAVGAAVRTVGGEVFTGCNVENASYGLTVCAERNAVAAAVAGGMRPGELSAVAIVGDTSAGMLALGESEPVAPCGACRQVLSEFAAPECRVLSANTNQLVRIWKLVELLPEGFKLPSAMP